MNNINIQKVALIEHNFDTLAGQIEWLCMINIFVEVILQKLHDVNELRKCWRVSS